MQQNDFIKKIFPFLEWLPLVNKNTLRSDLNSGFVNAVIVLPQGIAFAMIAGLPPVYGIYTAMVVPVVAALFGSSYHLISGPTTAISIVFFSTLTNLSEPGTERYIQLALVLTFIVGVIQLIAGIIKLGNLVNYVTKSVLVGFVTGAAVLIATSQIRHMIGLPPAKDASFMGRWQHYFENIDEINYYVLAVALATLLIAVMVKWRWPKSPHLLIALVFGSLFNYFLDGSGHGVKTVREITAALPGFSIPDISLENIRILWTDGLAIALLGIIEAVAIAQSIALKSGQKLNPNVEFRGQGLSNIVGSFFSCYAGSGSFTRSGLNYEAGAKTPLSAVFAAISLALIILLIGPAVSYLPEAAIGGVILLVAYGLIDVKLIKLIVSLGKIETGIMLITFLASLFTHLEYAIFIGVFFSISANIGRRYFYRDRLERLRKENEK